MSELCTRTVIDNRFEIADPARDLWATVEELLAKFQCLAVSATT
jgi:hypothetical protein